MSSVNLSLFCFYISTDSGRPISSTHIAEEAMSSLLRAEQISLMLRWANIPVYKVSRERNQSQRERLILQTPAREEPLTAKAKGPWAALLSMLIPIQSLGRWEIKEDFIKYFLPLITEITNLKSFNHFTPLPAPLL